MTNKRHDGEKILAAQGVAINHSIVTNQFGSLFDFVANGSAFRSCPQRRSGIQRISEHRAAAAAGPYASDRNSAPCGALAVVGVAPWAEPERDSAGRRRPRPRGASAPLAGVRSRRRGAQRRRRAADDQRHPSKNGPAEPRHRRHHAVPHGLRRRDRARREGTVWALDRDSAARATFVHFTVMVIFFETTSGLNGKCLASPSTSCSVCLPGGNSMRASVWPAPK
jgi:hypothetical protein